MILVPRHKKNEYFNHFVVAAYMGFFPTGVTGKRLRKAKSYIYASLPLWNDMVNHGIMEMTPEEMHDNHPQAYNHCCGNFWGIAVRFILTKEEVKRMDLYG